jgi:hypothetical protein
MKQSRLALLFFAIIGMTVTFLYSDPVEMPVLREKPKSDSTRPLRPIRSVVCAPTHWAFLPPRRPAVPNVRNRAWVRNPIDAFVALEQEARGLHPAPEADRRTLIRRLSFDLTGLPPSVAEVDAFVEDRDPFAYERVVERLLASVHYGERLAVSWLDLVRYADTEGYGIDADRRVSRYRDFVVRSFNRNERFDDFTIRQLAGDLLPGATQEDRIASGYNRMLMNSQEGCADPKERRARYAADRVRNVGAVWLGLTMGCAECHDHRFDPLTTRDFYRLAAFFADIQETAIGEQAPCYFLSAKQELQEKELEERITRSSAALKQQLSRSRAAQQQWETKLKRAGYRGVPETVQAALCVNPTDRNPEQVSCIEQYYAGVAPELASLNQTLLDARAKRAALLRDCRPALITTSGPRRVVRVLPRGNWQDSSGEVVGPGLPAIFQAGAGELPGQGSRLDLARWIVSPRNPLTARVLVNRLWKMTFGTGLVATLDDFGARGAGPTHPELLDWLAVELIEQGWDVKTMLKLIVTSSTYRQSSVALPKARERDPTNAWLTRQNRFRLDAEFIRDNALSIGGLLDHCLGGESVKPYQPEGYWADRFHSKTYQANTGPDQHRRGLYTFWCRNYLHPALALFDAPSRQSCTAERPRSTTPLQALALLHDVSQGEAARGFALRFLQFSPASERLNRAFQFALAREVTPAEAAVLERLQAREAERFRITPEAALALVRVADSPLPSKVDVSELAAWISVARVILNLRETITRY